MSPGKGYSSGFQGNCNNCGAYGHKAADCDKPRQSGGYHMVDQYANPSPNNVNYCAFMVTSLDDTFVDYRNPWHTIGDAKSKLSNQLKIPDEKPSNLNRYHALQEE